MEEKKEKKKLNKKPLLICLAIALVFAIIGIVDIKSNAAEGEVYTSTIRMGLFRHNFDGSVYTVHGGNFTLSSEKPMYGYYWSTYATPTNVSGQKGYYIVFSESEIFGYIGVDGYDKPSDLVTINGKNYYMVGESISFGKSDLGPQIVEMSSSDITVRRTSKYYESSYTIIQEHYDGSIQYDIDYDTLPIDDDMVVPNNVKRNVFTNDVNDTGLVDTNRYIDIYDLISWDNTSDIYRIQIQRCPIVQIYKTPLLGKTTFVKEYLGEWETEVVFDDISNEYLKQTDLKALTLNDNDIIHFKNSLTYDLGAFEQDFIYIGYRIRYIDCENEKASPWIILLPTHSKDSYESSVQYSNGSSDKTNNADGVFNDYRDLGNVQDAIDDVKTENNFKDKYEIIDGDVDTQEATNWLYSVVNFIKGTPQVVGSVLGFLPQPILYGMYVTIFLGVIASGLAIIKALF